MATVSNGPRSLQTRKQCRRQQQRGGGHQRRQSMLCHGDECRVGLTWRMERMMAEEKLRMEYASECPIVENAVEFCIPSGAKNETLRLDSEHPTRPCRYISVVLGHPASSKLLGARSPKSSSSGDNTPSSSQDVIPFCTATDASDADDDASSQDSDAAADASDADEPRSIEVDAAAVAAAEADLTLPCRYADITLCSPSSSLFLRRRRDV